MIRFGLKSLLATVAVVAVTSGANAHWDRPSCYIEVHDACFNHPPPCSPGDYDDALDQCDFGYPSVVPAKRLKAPAAARAAIVTTAEYKKKIETIRKSFN